MCGPLFNITHSARTPIAASVTSARDGKPVFAKVGDKAYGRLAVLAGGYALKQVWIISRYVSPLLPPLLFVLVSWYALVVGGANQEPAPWDEGRLRAEIDACLAQSLGAKETSRRLAAPSGWPRREVYRLVVKAARERRAAG